MAGSSCDISRQEQEVNICFHNPVALMLKKLHGTGHGFSLKKKNKLEDWEGSSVGKVPTKRPKPEGLRSNASSCVEPWAWLAPMISGLGWLTQADLGFAGQPD